MQILTDRGMDLAPEQMQGLNLRFAPLRIVLEGKTYSSGVDLEAGEFYQMLSETDSFPTTSQPSAGEFAEIYREMAKTDADILSIHVSSGLSGTYNAAVQGAKMVPEANITVFDSKTLSVPLGWQVEAAGKAIREGWSLERILDLLRGIQTKVEGLYTLQQLNYLIHGGRISHLKGLAASMLNIKPVIGVDHDNGKYVTHAQEITLKRAISKMGDVIASIFPGERSMRVQLLHGQNPEAVDLLHRRLDQQFDCHWEPTVPVAPVLGAHTGPSLVGLAAAPVQLFMNVPA
ncbi:MAG: DegV family protein [Anaerolineaceae bacterium]|jgi:DegV family protein with EDD domain